ncbi:MAG: AbrB/MazE/SpoVT family DNA-binding domain-containing protein [Candidatus Woesearchaeota archaeon]|nr:AbrB/MazE/SpoVT family DNA-binding domain-containing protein [Candidatus Woesearchaeota archaeon]
MKRKLVRQGRNALTVTLPAEWTKKFGLKAGDEVDIEQKDRNIIIGGEGEKEIKRASIDATKISERVLRWQLSGLHKGGWDEIEIIFEKKEAIDVIDDLMKNLFMGFAIVEQTDKRCLIKSISREMETEFDAILKRAFLVTISMGDSIIDMIKKDKLKGIKELTILEKTNNQLTNFCERILNKRGYREYDKTCFVYAISWNLEKVCDNYKYICDFIEKNPSIRISKELLEIFEMSNSQIRGYSSLFSKFKTEELVELNKKRKQIVLLS